jgi:hypothetical protein
MPRDSQIYDSSQSTSKLTIDEVEMGRLVCPPSTAEVRYDPVHILRRWCEEVYRVHAHRLSRRVQRLDS